MDVSLFQSGEDISTATRKFIHKSGTPAALNLMTTNRYPHEGIGISQLFPEILTFARTAGAQGQDFYSSNIDTTKGHNIMASALPAEPAQPPGCQGGVTRKLVDVSSNDPFAQGDWLAALGVDFAEQQNGQTWKVSIPHFHGPGIQFWISDPNIEGGRFVNHTKAMLPSEAGRPRYYATGLFIDLNNDGWDDIVVPNGFLTRQIADDL